MSRLELNRTYECKAIAFNEQLPISAKAGTVIGESAVTIPKGIQHLGDGSIMASFYAPEAGVVSLVFAGHWSQGAILPPNPDSLCKLLS